MQSSLVHDESMTNNESGGNPTDKALSCDMGHVAGQDRFIYFRNLRRMISPER